MCGASISSLRYWLLSSAMRLWYSTRNFPCPFASTTVAENQAPRKPSSSLLTSTGAPTLNNNSFFGVTGASSAFKVSSSDLTFGVNNSLFDSFSYQINQQHNINHYS